jgi:hypothetical protein
MKTFTTTLKLVFFHLLFLSFNLHANSHLSESSKDPEKLCVVLVTNKNYFEKFLQTLNSLVTAGNYHGDICLVIGDDLVGDALLNSAPIKDNKVVVKHFPDLKFPNSFLAMASRLPNSNKLFQYHKFHLFNPYFKQWNTIFYIDSGMSIYSDVRPIIDQKLPNTLVAHSDAYPSYIWKLRDQFTDMGDGRFRKLAENFDLSIDYFQTTMMLYDTSIIQERTFEDLYNLAVEYPMSHNNDQGTIALYFTQIMPVWRQIATQNAATYFYDYVRRDNQKNYIMIKRP